MKTAAAFGNLQLMTELAKQLVAFIDSDRSAIART
jgi:hypothetical protein